MKRLCLFLLVVSILLLGLSCKPKAQETLHRVSVYKEQGLVHVATISGSNQVATAVLVKRILQTNGIHSVVEGSLEYYVRVSEKDVNKAVLLLTLSRDMKGLDVKIPALKSRM